MQLRDELRVGPGPVDLAGIDPRGTPGVPDRKDAKKWARDQLAEIGAELARHQEMLYATAKSEAPNGWGWGAGSDVARERRRVLLVLQAMDCGGKDGATKRVAGAMNPLGLHIVAFGKPTEEELAHDFLWRIRRALPEPGYVGVFNRSHYEDVLVVRVESLVPARTWRARYDKIKKFERELVDDGVRLLKVMLQISYEEQRQRLQDRLDDPTKYWKYNPADLETRMRWDDYQAAYADVLDRCGTEYAPWYVVPADRKWYRDWAVATLLLDELRQMGLSYPPADFDLQAESAKLAAT